MTNKEWLQSLCNKALARVIVFGKCSICANSGASGICSLSSELRSSYDCYMGIGEELNQERRPDKKSIEPMPEIKIGDVLRIKFTNGDEVYTASVVGEDYMYSVDSGYGLAQINDSHYKVIEIWRFNGKRLEVIWRADNDK